ncbi:hypothetical protein GOBAR_DD08469 [Gossypium barbadense]|nr:hypothetical protein GOBAR_DD08469 [Gossypium barbadense]
MLTNCASQEEVLQLQMQELDIEETYVIDSQLREMSLICLPKLKHVWTKDHKGKFSFESLQQVRIQQCWSLKALFPFSIAKDLQQLKRLAIASCGLEEIVSKSVEESDLQEICFTFNQLSFLKLWFLPYLTYFYPGVHKTTWPALKRLRIFRLSPQLEKVSFTRGDIEMISDSQFYNLESLELGSCNFKELASFESGAHEDKDMIITIPKIKKLKLSAQTFGASLFTKAHKLLFRELHPKLTETNFRGRWAGDLYATVEQLYKEQLDIRGLKHLKLSEFPELIDIWSRNPQEMLDFTTLEFLEVCDSNNLRYLFNLSTAFDLGQLRQIEIKRCGMHKTTWLAPKRLRISSFGRIKIFGHEESQIQHPLFLIEKVIPQLEKVSFTHGDIEMISDGQRFYNLESLELGSCNFKELAYFESDACEDEDMVIMIPKIKKLKLIAIKNIRHLWKQDSPLDHICANVWKCNEMLALITSFKAQSLVCLVTMRIRECEMIREVVASNNDETSYEIVFTTMKRLELHCLKSLTSFCSGSYTLRLAMHLKFSKFSELIDIWSRSPQEMLDFTTLEFLEVCDSNNLRYIFYFSTTFGLRQLRKMEIKRCGNLEQVIKEEGSTTMVEEVITDSSKIISIFLRLQSIIVESCPDMRSFYLGSKSLEYPSLIEIKVANCSNMTTFVSTFSRDEDKEAIIDDEVDNIVMFFSDKVVFPKLEKLTISDLKNVKRIWYKQLHLKSFSNLKELKAEHCDALLNIFPPFFLGVFERLEKLTVTDCASLEEVFNSKAKDLQQLESLIVDSCGVEEIVSKKMHNITCPMLERLRTYWSTKIKKFGHVVSQLLLIGEIIPQLEHISLTTEDISMITGGQFTIDSHIKVLEITKYLNDSTVFSFCFLQRFSNLEKIEMVYCNFRELSPYEGDVGEERDVTILTNITRASSSSRNLTTLEVWYCKEMVELITSPKAQCLEQLVTLKRDGCQKMREVSKCPAMENFCNGALSTPKLQEVQTRWDVRRCWDLNATIEQLNKEECEVSEETDKNGGHREDHVP